MLGDNMDIDFFSPDLLALLEAMNADALDEVPFGVIGMSSDGVVVSYNKTEATAAGLTPARVIGRHFFTSVAPCTNNFMIAQRYEGESSIDDVIDYVFTLRMAPTPVQLRMLKSSSAERMYMVVKRRTSNAN